MIRQRGSAATSSSNSQDMNEMEEGVLLDKGNTSTQKDYECSSRGSQFSVRSGGTEPNF